MYGNRNFDSPPAHFECLAEKCPTKMYRIGMRDKFGEPALGAVEL